MGLEPFLFFCLAVIFLAVYVLRDNKKIIRSALILGVIGFVIGFIVEFWGTSTGQWNYAETGSLWKVFDTPIEIIFGYFTGMFFLGLTIHYLFRYYDESRRLSLLRIFPVIGVIMIILAGLHTDVPLAIGLTFLAIWGIMVSEKKSVPVTIGLLAFIGDIAVEGTLSLLTDYYDWTIGVSLAFMLVGIFIGGLLTIRKCDPDSDFCFAEK